MKSVHQLTSKNNLARIFLTIFVLAFPLLTNAQTAYITVTEQPCYATHEPAAKFSFKADPASQKVIYTVENFHSKEISSYSDSNCTVIDKENWNCDKAFSSDGSVFRKNKDGDTYHYCHFKKKILGGWELIATRSENTDDARNLEIGKKIDRLLLGSLTADVFKRGPCSENIRKFNPVFYSKNHFAENGEWVKQRFKLNKEISKLLTNESFAEFVRSNRDDAEKRLRTEMGPAPSALKCGEINGRIDKIISSAKEAM